MVRRHLFEIGVVGFACQGIVEDLVEAFSAQLLADEVAQTVLFILAALVG